MSKKIVDGVWVIECDWRDPESNTPCALGLEGEPAMFVDPNGGRNPEDHFQCGRHHGIIPQEEKEEFQIPEGHKLYNTVIRSGQDKAEVEEINDGD